MSRWLTRLWVLVALSFLGCQNSPTHTTLLLDWLVNPNHVALYAGLEKGIFAEHGIDLEILRLHDPADTYPMTCSGKVDISLVCSPYLLRAVSRGYPLRIIATWIDTALTGCFFRQEANIQSWNDLSGKTLGTTSMSPVHLALMQDCLDSAGAVPTSVQRLSFDGVVGLATGAVDVVFGMCCNVEPEQLRSLGMTPGYLLMPHEHIPDFSELVFVMGTSTLEKDPSLAKRFQKAIAASLDFARKNPEEAFALYLQALPHKSFETAEWERIAWEKTLPFLASSQDVDIQKWTAFCEWMQEKGLLERPFLLTDLFSDPW